MAAARNMTNEELQNEVNDQHDTEAQEETTALRPEGTNDKGLDRYQKLGLWICVALTLLGGTAIAVVSLVDFGNDQTASVAVVTNADTPLAEEIESNTAPTERTLKKPDGPTMEPTYEPTNYPTFEPTTPAPTQHPTTSMSPSSAPSSTPTAAPTVPQMGCRRDRFDNEGNQEENHKLFAGSFVCSDDAAQRYWFGIDPDTGNLIWKDTFTNQVKTYYTNDWHRNYLEQQGKRRRTEEQENKSLGVLDIPKNSNSTEECIEWVRQENEETGGFTIAMVTIPNCTASASYLEDIYPDTDPFGNGTLIVVEAAEEFTGNPSAAPTTVAPSPAPTEEETFVDYYFSLSTEATFRIHRVYRTIYYEIIDEVLHWELPSTYNITEVYKNCLFTHDCPYMHLHQDGVMVLAWLDFENSKWSDGWMEKNIKRCYNFNTTDIL